MTAKPLHIVTHPDGTQDMRRSDRVYTHAVVLENPWYTETWRYGVVQWSQSQHNADKGARTWQKAARRHPSSRPNITVVEVERPA